MTNVVKKHLGFAMGLLSSVVVTSALAMAPEDEAWFTNLTFSETSRQCTILQNQGQTTCEIGVKLSTYLAADPNGQGTATPGRTFVYKGSAVTTSSSTFTPLAVSSGNNAFYVNGAESTSGSSFSGNLVGVYEDYTPLFTHSASSHNSVVGDFDGNGEWDTYYQPKVADTIGGIMPVVANAYLDSTIHKAWTTTHPQITAISDWSEASYAAFSGNFNSNPGDELLLLGHKTIILLHGDIITPIVTFPEVNNAIVSWDGSNQASHSEFEFDANPADYVVHVGDLTGDGYDEIFLQAKLNGRASHILSNTGALIQTLNSGFLNIDWSAQSYTASIQNGNINLVNLINSSENNVAETNSSGVVTNLQTEVTKPTISGDSVRYVYKGQTYYFEPTSTSSTASLTFALSGHPSWMSVNSSNGVINETVPLSSGNESHVITMTLTENKGYTVPVSLSFQLDILEAFTIDETKDYDVYIAANGEVYLKAKDGSGYYRLKKDGDSYWLMKISAAEFSASGAVLDAEYQVVFNDYNQDGNSDLVIYPPSDSSKQSFGIFSVNNVGEREVQIGNATEFFIPDAPLVEVTVPENQSVGAVEGSGGVAGGAAGYTIPIAIPPGRKGMQPDVKLSYSSNSGNGLLGKGWGLSSGSYIRRCGSIVAIDGVRRSVDYSTNDNFCLDGTRLIKSGSYYYPELNPNIRVSITQTSGVDSSPTEFKVELSNGNTRFYGNSGNSLQSAVGVSGTKLNDVLTWAIYEERDLHGNKIEYSYDDKGNGEYTLAEILYTGTSTESGDRKVSFTYEARNDVQFSYLAGGRTTRAHRLQSIDSYIGTQHINQYTLAYKYSVATQASLLTSVKQCAYETTSNSAVEKCLKPTTFTWQDIAQSYTVKKYYDQANMNNWASEFSDLDMFVEPDYNGDGVKELEVTRDNRDWTRLDYTNVVMDAKGQIISENNGQYKLGEVLVYFSPNSADYEFHEAPKGVDFNNDGLTDKYWWINASSDNSSAEFAFIKYSNFANGVAANAEYVGTGLVISRLEGQGNQSLPILPHVADLNGDGLLDLLHNGGSASDNTKRVLHMYINTGTADAPAYANGKQLVYSYPYLDNKTLNSLVRSSYDFDGNGILDIYLSSKLYAHRGYSRILFGELDSNGSLSYSEKSFDTTLGFAQSEQPSRNYSQFIDLNNDGLVDYLFVPHTEGQTAEHTWHYKLNLGGVWGATRDTGISNGVDKRLSTVSDIYTPRYANTFKIGDWDNDGRTDILIPKRNTSGEYIPLDNYCFLSTAFNGAQAGKQSAITKQASGLYDKKVVQYCSYGTDSLYPNYANRDYALYNFDMINFSSNADGTIDTKVKDANVTLPGVTKYSDMTDVNGDGITDFIIKRAKWTKTDDISPTNSNLGGMFTEGAGIYIMFGQGAKPAISSSDVFSQRPDLLIQVENGLGYQEEWEYFPLTHPGYANESTPLYQTDQEVVEGDDYRFYSHFIEGTHVVASHKKSNGIGGLNENRYFYKGAVFNNQGRGFQGFKQITVDNPTGVRAVTDFHQVFPIAGKIKSAQTCIKDNYNLACANNRLTHSSFTYGQKTAFVNTSLWVYATNSKVINYAMDNYAKELLNKETVISPNDIDAYGNVSKVVTTVNNGYSTVKTTQESSFLPNELDWWINKLSSSTVSNETITGSVLHDALLDPKKQVRTTYTWTSKRQVDLLTVEPILGGGKTTVVDTDYNTAGLPKLVTTYENGNSTVTRQVSTSYSSNNSTESETGYFVYKVTNDLSHTMISKTIPEFGLVKEVIDANGLATQTAYDAFGRVEQVTPPSGTGQPVYSRFAWCDSCDQLTDTNIVYKVTSYQAGAPQSTAYKDILNRTILVKTEGFDGTSIYASTDYDALGRKTFESIPSTNKDIDKGTSFSSYDELGRLTSKSISQPNNATMDVSYVYTEHKTDITVIADGTTLNMSRIHSGTGQLMKTTDALLGETQYAYDALGNPIVLQDANASPIKANYNALGQKVSVDDPNMGVKTFAYTQFGEIASETDANSDTTYYEYDSLGRLTFRYINVQPTTSNRDLAEASFSYDTASCKGVPKSEARNNLSGGESFSRNYFYDSKCRMDETVTNIDGTALSMKNLYDGNYGRIKGVIYPTGLVAHSVFNTRGYLTHSKNGSTGYVYQKVEAMNARGQLTQALKANGVLNEVATYYEESGQMKSIHTDTQSGGNQRHRIDYKYDGFGNLKEQQVENIRNNAVVVSTETYAYDALHRLTSSNLTVGASVQPSIAYDYDAVGNLIQKDDYASSYTYGDLAKTYSNAGPNAVRSITKLLASGGTQTINFSYDNNGNLLTGDGKTITYNTFNKPLSIAKNGVTSWFSYGADQMRYKQVKTGLANGDETTLYVGKAYEEVTYNGVVKKKVYLGDTIISETEGGSEAGTKLGFVHRDRLGSVVTITDESGNVIDNKSYDPFGKPRKGTLEKVDLANVASLSSIASIDGYSLQTNRGFTDHEHLDDAQLIHMNGRVYDYNLGRFLSVDPFIQEPGNSQSMNPYSYILNNPLAGTDPSGYYFIVNCSGRINCSKAYGGYSHTQEVSNGEQSDESKLLNDTIKKLEDDPNSVFNFKVDSLFEDKKNSGGSGGKPTGNSGGTTSPNQANNQNTSSDVPVLPVYIPGIGITDVVGVSSKASRILSTDTDIGILESEEEFEGRMQEMLRAGHAGIGRRLSYREAMWLYQNGEGTPITVDGRVLDVLEVGSRVMANPFPFLDDLKVHGHVATFRTENGEVRIQDGMYDFEPRIMDNPNDNSIITARNLLNLQAIKEHGDGTPYMIRYRYSDEDFE